MTGLEEQTQYDVQDRAALVALSGLPGMGPRRLRALVLGDAPGEVWRAVGRGDGALAERVRCRPGGADRGALLDRWRAVAADVDADALLARHRAADVQVVVDGDPAWPFTGDPDPPPVLFARGSLSLLGDVSRVAIVGTRNCTAYGTDVANEVGAALSLAGVSVVSGLAAGIDGAAHVGSLGCGPNGAPPVGVVATGLDVVYPRDHRRLWRDVAGAGLLVSEAPLGTKPEKWRFPARNRIIAALADAVVVVESPTTGGSMHTVDEALERGVPVFAVPGPMGSRASAGTNRLLADGAMALCDVADVLELLGFEPETASGRRRVEPTDGPARRLLDALGHRPATLDQLVAWTGLDIGVAALAVDELERDGWVTRDGGWLERRR